MYEYQAAFQSAHDGDTLRLAVDLGFNVWVHELDVRLMGIDCPELGRADRLGENARDFVIAWFSEHPGPYVLKTVKDRKEKYGRYLATVRADDMRELVIDLLAAGLAQPYSGQGPRPPWA